MTSKAQVAGFILRAQDRAKTAAFYRALGLEAHEHLHGGPIHFELGPTDPGCVAEIYKWSPNFPSDALMVKVSSIDDALARIAVSTEARNVGYMRLAYVTDPDGRAVMVFEQITQQVTGLAAQTCLPCGGGIPPLSKDEIAQYLGDLNWWMISGKGAIERVFAFKNFKEANAFVRLLEPIAESEDHHPDIHIESYKHVRITLITHAISALTVNDFIVAAKIDALMK